MPIRAQMVKPEWALQIDTVIKRARIGGNILVELAKLSDHNEFDLPDRAITDPPGNCNGRGPLARLRQAVTAAGGTGKAADRSGVPLRTLSHYLAGRDMKASAMIALAEACGVTLDWLATGKDPMRPGETAPHQPAAVPPPEPSRGLFATVDVGKLAGCLEAAQMAFAQRGGLPSTDKLVQVALLLYDAVDEQAAALQAADTLMSGKPQNSEES